MSTIETAFRGRVPLVNLDKGSAIPLRFVFELPHQLRPSDIRDGLSEFVVFQHASYVQVLNSYQSVVFAEVGRELVGCIFADIDNPGMLLCQLLAGLLAVLSAKLAA